MAPSGSTPVVEARDLSRRFGRRWAYARVDLVVQPGERVLIVGANGSGKTTLLRSLATVLRPSQGTLRLFGLDPRANGSQVRPRLAFLGHSLGLYEDLSAADNLRVVARLADKPPPDVRSLLERVGLEHRPDPVRAFSAGMRKRTQVAALLVQEPDLILLDEPFAALDPAGVTDLVDLLRGMPGTLLVASHRIARAATLCDRAVLLDEGLVRWRGPADRAVEAWKTLHPGDGGDGPDALEVS